MKFKIILISFLLSAAFLFTSCTDAENLTGYWSGTMEMNGKTIDMAIDADSNAVLFTSYDLMLIEQPVSDIDMYKGDISFSIVLDVEVVFNGMLSGNEIRGRAAVSGGPPEMEIAFQLER